MKYKIRNDSFRRKRGGTSSMLEIECMKCNTPLLIYQKDGRGGLLRLYLDRIFEINGQEYTPPTTIEQVPNLRCYQCYELIGVPTTYKKESRPAYRLLRGTIRKNRL